MCSVARERRLRDPRTGKKRKRYDGGVARQGDTKPKGDWKTWGGGRRRHRRRTTRTRRVTRRSFWPVMAGIMRVMIHAGARRLRESYRDKTQARQARFLRCVCLRSSLRPPLCPDAPLLRLDPSLFMRRQLRLAAAPAQSFPLRQEISRLREGEAPSHDMSVG